MGHVAEKLEIVHFAAYAAKKGDYFREGYKKRRAYGRV